MNLLLDNLIEQINSGIMRKTAVSASRWAELYRVIDDHPLNYDNHPWSRALRDCTRPWVGPKAAQMGYTEAALDVAFFNIDQGRSCLYLLPKKSPDATDFSKSRFDPAIEASPYLSNLFMDVNNVGYKRAGRASLYIRGSRSKSAVKSIPTPLVIFDEYDEMLMSNVRQAHERMSGKIHKQWIKFSTPTAPDYGIDEAYKTTTQQHYFFRCSTCGKWTELDFPDGIVIYADSILDLKGLRQTHYKGTCGCALYHESKRDWLKTARWQPTANHDAEVDGFYINQFYSFTISPKEIAEVAIKAEANPSDEQEYWNSKGGKAHIPKGAGLHDEQFLPLISSTLRRTDVPRQGWITMGVDQGKKIYFNIDLWRIPPVPGRDINAKAHCINLNHGIVHRFEDLDRLMREYQVLMCVIDAHPERREANKFMQRFYGFVKLCFYSKQENSKTISEDKNEQTISVNRTFWIDQALSRFHNKTISLPMDMDPVYQRHHKALIRRYTEDSEGNQVARYINRGPDHFAHAKTYSEIALPLAISFKTNENVENFL